VKDDATLIAEVLGGNSSAYETLVHRYQDRLFNTLNMIHASDNYQETEDVVQETFVQAYVKLTTFRGNSGFYTWLYRIAFNLMMSRKRRKRPTVSVEQRRDQGSAEPQCQREAPSERMHREELVGQVQGALANLPQEYRAILVLREMDGCDYDTIADMLQLPLGTVRSRLHRARSQLREQMRHVYDEMLAN
jgi:RNA polymerase sigma-70 factor, ECF subfamily